ncbi:MAG: MBL fold metallo-hydrolase [Culicoidibacterales bacterium]
MNIYNLISKKKKISTHIDKIEFNLGIFIVSIWIVKQNNAYFLIDTGMGRMAIYVIEKYIGKENIDKIHGVFLTHGHSDHVGGLKKLNQMYPNIPIIVEEIEIQYLTGQSCYPKRKKTEVVTFSEKIFQKLSDETAILLLEKSGLIPLLAPGHSPGHTCFYHSKDQVLIAGDLFTTSKKGIIQPPMKTFTANMELALQTGEQILNNYPNIIMSVTHGTEIKKPLQMMKESKWYIEEKNLWQKIQKNE